MKKHQLIPLLTAAGGAGSFLLRFLQNRSGFEPETGLPVPGDLFGILLPAALFLLAAAILFLSRQLPNEKEDSTLDFHENFSDNAPALMATIGGIFLWAASGAAGLASVFLGDRVTAGPAPGLYFPVDPASQKLDMILFALTLLSAICLFPAAIAARRGEKAGISSASTGNLILFSVIYLVLRLALSYREMSISSSQQTYYVELFALMFLILSLFRLSSFAFRCGKTRRFILFAAMAVILCITALADAASLPDRLFFAGGAALLLGFLMQRLSALTSEL